MTVPMFLILLRLLVLASLATIALATPAQPVPSAPREFRGMWIATVWNVDWPSKKGLPVGQLKSELKALILSAKQARLNAIVLQVRSYSDAIYPSELDPWSEFISGTMGRGPGENFDPLKFALEECHKNGILLHVWVNPFRAGVSTSVASDRHISRRHPNAVRTIGTRLWADPGHPDARRYALRVIEDIVKRYNVDAVHFDDKGFYPYPAELKDWGNLSEFPDTETFERFGGSFRSRNDWRRNNITSFLSESDQLIKSIRPSVMLGVSPFGIHKAGEPAGIKGTSAHDVLFTDCKAWMQRGMVDYMAPQLYWEIGSKGQPYEPLLRWWSSQNTGGRHLWPGIYTDKFNAEEILNQVRIARGTQGVTGHIHYTGRAILTNKGGIRDALVRGPFSYEALVPPSPWFDHQALAPPVGLVQVAGANKVLQVSPVEGQTRPFLYTVYVRTGGQWSFATVPATQSSLVLGPANVNLDSIAIASVDRLGNESQKVEVPVR